MTLEPTAQLAALANGGSIDLVAACEAIARAERSDLAPGSLSRTLDELAASFARDVTAGTAAHLVHWLSDRAAFRGNRDAYYEADNSYLDQVLARRTGIPITLTVVLLEVGRRRGLAIEGIGYPGHFLARSGEGEAARYLDVFNAAVYRDAAEVLARFPIETPGDRGDIWLAAVTPRQIVTRMLHNLKAVYARLDDLPRLERTLDLQLAFSPWDFDERRDRGLVRAARGDERGAAEDLATYLEFRPDADDAGAVRRRLETLGR